MAILLGFVIVPKRTIAIAGRASEAIVTVNGKSSNAEEEEKEPWMEARKSNW